MIDVAHKKKEYKKEVKEEKVGRSPLAKNKRKLKWRKLEIYNRFEEKLIYKSHKILTDKFLVH